MRKITLLLLICFFASCEKDKNVIALKDLLSNPQLEEQVFTLRSDTINFIVGKFGTQIMIDPQDLEGFDGNQSLKLELVELTTKEALVKYNAQTIADGKWLISGGAYNIQVKNGDKYLELKSGKVIQVSFPQLSTEAMKIFEGNHDDSGNMNWYLTDKNLEEKVYPWIFLKDTIVLDEEMTRINRVDQYRIAFNTVLKDSGSFSEFEKDERVLASDTTFFKNDTLYSQIRLNIISETDSDEIFFDSIDASQLKEYNNLIFKRNNTLRLYQAIEIAKLGWINVDRFYPENLERAELTIESAAAMGGNASIYIVDRSNMTVLNLYNTNVSLPLNKTFDLIAFDVSAQGFKAAKTQIRLSKNRTVKVKFKEVSEAKLQELLKFN
ncbi:MAG: hypothetical protein CL868_12245 [Cytophagaceae bacterium]|nr:hypothetical protein [Cytophagaceae bacterium]|tara:strand:+ start:3525 stop:4667 length:1143 start_codon:yes stop_codon:yes gene_type:complete